MQSPPPSCAGVFRGRGAGAGHDGGAAGGRARRAGHPLGADAVHAGDVPGAPRVAAALPGGRGGAGREAMHARAAGGCIGGPLWGEAGLPPRPTPPSPLLLPPRRVTPITSQAVRNEQFNTYFNLEDAVAAARPRLDAEALKPRRGARFFDLYRWVEAAAVLLVLLVVQVLAAIAGSGWMNRDGWSGWMDGCWPCRALGVGQAPPAARALKRAPAARLLPPLWHPVAATGGSRGPPSCTSSCATCCGPPRVSRGCCAAREGPGRGPPCAAPASRPPALPLSPPLVAHPAAGAPPSAALPLPAPRSLAAHDVYTVHENRVQHWNSVTQQVSTVLDVSGGVAGAIAPGLGQVQLCTLCAR